MTVRAAVILMLATRIAVAAGVLTSSRDTDPAATALDYSPSQRALIAVSSRAGDVTELGSRAASPRLARPQRPPALNEPTVRAAVRQAVRDVRTAPPAQPVIRRRIPRWPRCAVRSTTSSPIRPRSAS
jgi:hypothetical protein